MASISYKVFLQQRRRHLGKHVEFLKSLKGPGHGWRDLLRYRTLLAIEGASPMTIIDSQVHAYEANTPKRPWHSVPNWPDHVTGDEMVAAMDEVGVDGA